MIAAAAARWRLARCRPLSQNELGRLACARLGSLRARCGRLAAAAAATTRSRSALAPSALRWSDDGALFDGVGCDRGCGGAVTAGSGPAVAAN